MEHYISDCLKHIDIQQVKREFYFITDPMSIFLFVEEEIEKMLGFRAEEIIGKRLTDIVDERNLIVQFKEDRYSENTISLPLVSKYNNIVFVNILYKSYYQDGVHKGYYGSIIDISKEKELEKKYNLLTKILDDSKDIIYYFKVKPTMGFEYISKSIEKIFGYTSEDNYIDKELIFRTVHPDYEEEFRQKVQGKIDYSKPIVTKWLDKNNVYHCLEDHSIPDYDIFGNLVGIFGICREIEDEGKKDL